MSSKPAFTVVPTSSFDKMPAKQLEAILNTPNNIAIYQILIRISMKDVIMHGTSKNTLEPTQGILHES